MALDYNTALDEYGAVATFAQSNHDVSDILQQAIQGEWDAARFERALWGTNWYKSLSDTQQQLQVQQATDPATYTQNLNKSASDIMTQAQSMGIALDWNTSVQLGQQALWNGWSPQLLQSRIATTAGVAKDANGYAQAQAGDVQNHIRSTAAAYGVPMTQSQLDTWSSQVVGGVQTTGGIDNAIVGMASKLYPQYTQDFTEGRTLSDVAQPFIQQMGKTLELDQTSIDVNDPTIMKALQGDGKTPMTMYQFQQGLKADPRWGKTDNAKNQAYDTLAQIGKDWGFM